jgi:hypothetical protein
MTLVHCADIGLIKLQAGLIQSIAELAWFLAGSWEGCRNAAMLVMGAVLASMAAQPFDPLLLVGIGAFVRHGPCLRPALTYS